MDKSIQSLAESLDLDGMCDLTRRFTDDLETALSLDTGLESDSDWTGVLFLGMGGSGSAGRFMKTISDEEGGLQFAVWSDYGLPSWWGPDWLIIATSYSGNTEETLDGVMQALDSGGTVIGISSGGKMSEILEGNDDSICLPLPAGQMPRSAFGHILGTQLSVCWSIGVLARPSEVNLQSMIGRIREASTKFDITGGDGMSEMLARNILDMDIGIVSPRVLNAAAYRFTCQINENSEAFAKHSEVPEMNHNEIVAWFSESPRIRALVMLTCEGVHERTNSRMQWMEENLNINNVWKIHCQGNSLLERLIYAAHLSDWVSISLALLRGVNPTSMDPIPRLKEHLSGI